MTKLVSILFLFIVFGSSIQAMDLYKWGKKTFGTIAGKINYCARPQQSELLFSQESLKEEEFLTTSPLFIEYTRKLLTILNDPESLNLLSFEEGLEELLKVNQHLNNQYNLKLIFKHNNLDDLQPLYEYRNKLEAQFKSLSSNYIEESALQENAQKKQQEEEISRRSIAALKTQLIHIKSDVNMLKKLDLSKEKQFLYGTDLDIINNLKSSLQAVRNNDEVINNTELHNIYNPDNISEDLEFLNDLYKKIENLINGKPIESEEIDTESE